VVQIGQPPANRATGVVVARRARKSPRQLRAPTRNLTGAAQAPMLPSGASMASDVVLIGQAPKRLGTHQANPLQRKEG